VPKDHPVIMTLHPRARAQAGSGLGLRRPERRRRRWRLWFCHRISEVGDDLGMRQAMSQSPSKPVAPVDRRLPCARSMGARRHRRKAGDRRRSAGAAAAGCCPGAGCFRRSAREGAGRDGGGPARARPPRATVSGTPRPSAHACARRGCCR
jgi:hypothetical protein